MQQSFFDIEQLKTNNKNRIQILEIVEKANEKVVEFESSENPDIERSDYIEFKEKLKRIQKKLDANEKFIKFLKNENSETKASIDVKNFNLLKYGSEDLFRLAQEDAEFNARNFFEKQKSCLGWGLIKNNALIDPKKTKIPQSITKKEIRKTPESPEKLIEEERIKEMSKIYRSIYDEKEKKLYFSMSLREDGKKYSFPIYSVSYSIIFDIEKNKTIINFSGTFLNNSKLYPEEVQILMLKKLIDHTTIKNQDDKTDFQNFCKNYHTTYGDIDILKMISNNSLEINRIHVTNPKTLTLIAKVLGEESLSNSDRSKFLISSPNMSNSQNFLLHLNELLQENGHEIKNLDDKSVYITVDPKIQNVALGFSNSIRCCVDPIFRCKDLKLVKNSLKINIVWGRKSNAQQSLELPQQLIMGTPTVLQSARSVFSSAGDPIYISGKPSLDNLFSMEGSKSPKNTISLADVSMKSLSP